MLARSLKTFLTVARTQSLTRAATELHLAQSSVSDQIQTLEAALGVDLFTRSRTALALTSAGAILRPYVEELVLLAEDARAAVAEVAAHPAGALTIGALETIASTALTPWLVDFRHAHPHIALTVKVAGSGELARQLAAGEIDVAFRFGHPEGDERLASRTILSVPLLLIAPRDERCVLGRDLAALCGASFIVTEVGCVYRRLFEEAFTEAGLTPPRPIAEVGSVSAIARLVASGGGVGLVPELAVTEALARGEILGRAWPGSAARLSLLWRRRRIQPPALKQFLAASKAFEPIRPAGVRPRHAEPYPS